MYLGTLAFAASSAVYPSSTPYISTRLTLVSATDPRDYPPAEDICRDLTTAPGTRFERRSPQTRAFYHRREPALRVPFPSAAALLRRWKPALRVSFPSTTTLIRRLESALRAPFPSATASFPATENRASSTITLSHCIQGTGACASNAAHLVHAPCSTRPNAPALHSIQRGCHLLPLSGHAVAVGLRRGNTDTETDTETPRPLLVPDSVFPRNNGGRSTFFFFFFILRRMGKSKVLAHHTSTYFHTRRVSI